MSSLSVDGSVESLTRFFKTGKSAQIYKGHTAPVTAIAFCDRVPGSGDQEILISGSWDKARPLFSFNVFESGSLSFSL